MPVVRSVAPVLGCLVGLCIGGLVATAETRAADTAIQIQAGQGKYVVTAGGGPFAEVDYTTYAKPIIYPVYGPDQIMMTRHYPLRADVPGEPKDHPHHKSIWFAHGDVNGVSYWDERGKIANVVSRQTNEHTVELQNRLIDPQDGTRDVARETLTLSFGASATHRWIDWDIVVHAPDHDVTFGDTKEGTLGLRVHPHLQMEKNPQEGLTPTPATALNSEGVQGPDVWGKRARWVDYSAFVEGKPMGISFFDHPTNLRHPTTWHARAYGLFAANPFGLESLLGPGHDGKHTIPRNESLRLRYRLVFHRELGTAETIDGWYQTYVQDVR